MTLVHMRVTTAFAALAMLGVAACADRSGPTSVNIQGSGERASANADRSFTTAPASVGWQAQARSLVVASSLSPIVATRVYALLGVAQYGAAVDADKQVNADGTLNDNGEGFEDGGRRRFEAQRGAVAGASAQILSFLFPAGAAALEQRLLDEGTAGPGEVHPQFTRGVATGRAFGDVMIAWANHDGFSNPWTGTIPVGPGLWTRNPAPPGGTLPPIAGPQFGAMTPYFLTGPGQFHPPPPPAFGSTAFLTDLTEVSEISRTRTPEQLAAAQSLNLSSGTITSLGYFDQLASQYIGERRFDERAAAHVFALTNAAAMDAVIGCWEAKFSYFYIRPSQVNPPIGPPITLPIGLPNHPSYPSGHSCVSAAAAEVLKAFFPEHATTLDAQVAANGMSRIYAGIHYRFDITAGQALGREVARTALAYDQDSGLLAAVR